MLNPICFRCSIRMDVFVEGYAGDLVCKNCNMHWQTIGTNGCLGMLIWPKHKIEWVYMTDGSHSIWYDNNIYNFLTMENCPPTIDEDKLIKILTLL